MKRLITPVAIAAGLLALSAGSASAATLRVDDDQVQCAGSFPTISAAVTAAAPGDKIKVCPGTYAEQVTIPASKDGLTLESEKKQEAIIKSPPTMAPPNAIVHVDGAEDVTIRGFEISGPNPGPCSGMSGAPSPSELRFGVLIDNNGEAEVRDNDLLDIRNTGLPGNCQFTNAIQVGRSSGGPGTVWAKHNVVERYQKGGIIVNESGSSGRIEDNDVVGLGPTGDLAQNGIQFGFGAVGEADHNDVSGNNFTGTSTSSAGILLTQAGTGIEIDHNDVSANDVGIWVFRTDSSEVDHNKVSTNDVDGIRLQGSSSDSVTDTVVKKNKSHDNGDDGVALSTNAVANLVDDNDADDNAGSGIEAGSSAVQNQIEHNKAFGNAVFDCQDDSPAGPGQPASTSNFWIKDKGETENKPGLCT